MKLQQGTGYLDSLKVSPYLFINYQEENSKFRVETPGRYQLSRVTKVNISNTGTNRRHPPPDTMY